MAVSLFAAAGADVVVLDVQKPDFDHLRQGPDDGSLHYIEADVGDSDVIRAAVDEAVTKLGGIDGLFHHAGTIAVSRYHETTDDNWRRIMRTNVDGAFHVTREVLPHLIAQGGGDIVMTASISSERAFPLESAYCISKAAVLHMSRCIAVEYRDRNVRCNAICPAFTRTPHGMAEIEQLGALGADWSDRELEGKQGRICEPEEVAQAALFLMDRARSGFVNGDRIYLDNGWTASG